jgi:hypothetical protein
LRRDSARLVVRTINPHIHAAFIDGVYGEDKEAANELVFRALPHLTTRDVAGVLERTRNRVTKYVRRRGLLDEGDTDADAAEGDASKRPGLTRLAASAVSGATPPAGPEWRRGPLPLTHRAIVSSDRSAARSMGSRCRRRRAREAGASRAARRCSSHPPSCGRAGARDART